MQFYLCVALTAGTSGAMKALVATPSGGAAAENFFSAAGCCSGQNLTDAAAEVFVGRAAHGH